jgi:hypothetical protein
VLDELIAVFDQAISARESHAKVKTDKQLSDRARKGEARRRPPAPASAICDTDGHAVC